MIDVRKGPSDAGFILEGSHGPQRELNSETQALCNSFRSLVSDVGKTEFLEAAQDLKGLLGVAKSILEITSAANPESDLLLKTHAAVFIYNAIKQEPVFFSSQEKTLAEEMWAFLCHASQNASPAGLQKTLEDAALELRKVASNPA